MKNQQFGFRAGPTQTGLYNHRSRLEARNFGFLKKKCTIHVAKTKALISFAVTAKLICVFVFAYADCWFSHAAAQLVRYCTKGVKMKQTKQKRIFLSEIYKRE